MKESYFLSYNSPYAKKLPNSLKVYKILGENIVGPLPGVEKDREELDYYYFDVTPLIPKTDGEDKIATGKYEINLANVAQKGVIDENGHITLEPTNIDTKSKIVYLLPDIADEIIKMSNNEKRELKKLVILIENEDGNYILNDISKSDDKSTAYYDVSQASLDFLERYSPACLELLKQQDGTLTDIEAPTRIK